MKFHYLWQSALKNYSAVFLLCYLAVGLWYVFAIPPFQKPDEGAHYIKAKMLATNPLLCVTTTSPFHLTPTESKLIHLQSPVKSKEFCSFSPVGYIAHAPVLFIGQKLPFSVLFFTGRLLGFLLFCALLWHLIRIATTPSKHILMLVASFPIVLQQVTAYSYDIVLIGASFAYFVYATNKKVSVPIVAASLIIMMSTKSVGYEPLLFIVPTIMPLRPALAIIFSTMMLKTIQLAIFPLTPPNTIANPSLQLRYIVGNPLSYAVTLIKTTFSRAVFYAMSSIGILGWLEYGIPYWGYAVFGAGYAAILFHTQWKIRRALFIAICSASIVGYVLIHTALYLQWTEVGAALVDGVQGRYFIPYIPWLLYATGSLLHIKKRIIPPVLIFIGAFGWIVVAIVPVVMRFFS